MREARAFGFCPKFDDFKVVKITDHSLQGNRMTVADVYSLTTNSWKMIDDLIFTLQFGNNDWVFLNGTAYFNGLTVQKENVIVCYNTDKDAMRVISFPEISSARGYSLQIYGESVVLFIESSQKCFNMWVLNEGGTNQDCWDKNIFVNLNEIPSTVYWQVVGMRSNVEVLLLNCHLIHGHLLVSYNVENRTIKSFGWVTRILRASILAESLVMINI